MIRKPWCHNPGSSNDVVHGNVAAVLDVLHLIKNLWNLIHLGTIVASVTQIFQAQRGLCTSVGDGQQQFSLQCKSRIQAPYASDFLKKCDNLSGFLGTLPLDVIGYLLAVPWGLLQRLDDKRSSRGNNRAGGLPDIGFENNHFPELSIY